MVSENVHIDHILCESKNTLFSLVHKDCSFVCVKSYKEATFFQNGLYPYDEQADENLGSMFSSKYLQKDQEVQMSMTYQKPPIPPHVPQTSLQFLC